MLHRGWGKSVIIGVAEVGKEASRRPFQLVTGRVWMGSAFGGALGRTDDLITHRLPLERIKEGFELMKRGESIRGAGCQLEGGRQARAKRRQCSVRSRWRVPAFRQPS